jgi:hypothetical protein
MVATHTGLYHLHGHVVMQDLLACTDEACRYTRGETKRIGKEPIQQSNFSTFCVQLINGIIASHPLRQTRLLHGNTKNPAHHGR